MATYTVVKNDCLWTIAQKKLGNPYRWGEIADLNGISRSNPIIYVGQVLTLPGGSSPTPTTKTNTFNRPSIEYLGALATGESENPNEILARWIWSRDYTDHYEVEWLYYTGLKKADGSRMWVLGTRTTQQVDYPQSTYSVPDNAKSVRFKVLPVAKNKKDANGNETPYFTANWSTAKEYTHLKANLPELPETPSVSIEELLLTATLENISTTINADYIEFEVYKDDLKFKTSKTTIITETRRASYSCFIDPGSKYRVRCRSAKDGIYSDWTTFSSPIDAIPSAPSEITILRAEAKTTDGKIPVYIEWSKSETAKGYEIEYATNPDYFDVSSQTTSVTISDTTTKWTLYDLAIGAEYFFRVRATNDSGESGWTAIKSVLVGTTPEAPTTWSSTTTAVVGEPIILYWVHNAEDGSAQTHAKVELIINGTTYTEIDPEETIPEEDKYKTHHWTIDTTKYSYSDGANIQWRVQTAGVTLEWGEWSIQRTIDVYAKPTLDLTVSDSFGNVLNNDSGVASVTSFPIVLHAVPGPATQAPIGYYVSIKSNSAYEGVDDVGNVKMVNIGDEVYSKYFDINTVLDVDISANDVDLENNAEYTMTCSVTMNSGLTAESIFAFEVAWTDEIYPPNAEIAIDKESLSAYIRPYCIDENSELVPDVTLSVYRRDFDGSFIEIIKDIPNEEAIFVTDPHPALDYARYRIVSRSTSTGAVSFYDVPGIPVNESAVIIQWNETWSGFDSTEGEELAEKPWTGSLLRLPYNIDISDSNSIDVSLVKYIGRKRAVTYYGTQLGEKSNLKMEIDKEDKETLYALRRLSIWTGDVYVRKPDGSGYWSNVSVSFDQTHCEVTIPVSIDVTRVEGGV